MGSTPHLLSRPRDEQAPFDPLARMMAHEVRNILTPMRAKAQLAIDHPEDAARTQAALAWAIKTAQRISAITDTILLGAGHDVASVSIGQVLNEVLEALPIRQGQSSRVSFDIPNELSVNTAPAAFRHIMLNLLLNADRASAANNGNVHVTCSRSTWNTAGTPRSGVSIVIEDDGGGLDDAALSRLNGITRENPPSTSAQSQQSECQSGSHPSLTVGLVVVEKLLGMVDGEIQALNMPVGGARITVRIPDLDAAGKSAQSRAA